MNKILTISVAAYNVEKFLNKTLTSLIVKNSKYIEVLVVNDGSKDNTLFIAKQFENKYPEIFRIIDKKNAGHGSTINAGISNASGKYFCVLDGDDWFNSEGFNKYIDSIKRLNSDLIVSNYTEIFDGDGKKRRHEINGVEKFIEYNFDDVANGNRFGLANMAIKTSILKENKIKIAENSYYVDMQYIIFPIPFVNTVTFTGIDLYQYRVGQQTQSVSVENLIKNSNSHEKITNSLIEFAYKCNTYKNISRTKIEYISGIVSEMIFTQLKIFMLSPDSFENRKRLNMFMERIKCSIPGIKGKILRKMWCKMLFLEHGFFYHPIRFCLKIQRIMHK